MSVNTETIQRFYSAFQQRDHQTMNACYGKEIVFSDPAFGILYDDQVRNMWEMLCHQAKDLTIRFSDIEELDEEYATCQWVATYTFSKTGKRVENHIKAFMRFREGKIIEHSDAFKLSKWASQALGWKGFLFGWSGFLQRRIQKNAVSSLQHFMDAIK